MDFDLNERDIQGNTKYLIPGNSAKVSFTSGNLAGYTFEISAYNHSTRSFTLKYYTDERGYRFPSNDAAFCINPGDEYVLVDIYMPDSYIASAEDALLAAATQLLNDRKSPKATYSVELDPIYAKSENIDLQAGDVIQVVDDDLNINRDIRVIGIKKDILEPYRMRLSWARR